MPRSWHVPASLLAAVLGLAGAAHAAPATVAEALQALVAAGPLGSDAATLEALYLPRGFAPLWLDGPRPSAPAREALAELASADRRGLDPEDYDAALLARQARRLDAGAGDEPRMLARFDGSLSAAVLRLLSDLHLGRVNPRNVRFGYDVEPKRLDGPALLAAALRDGRVAPMLDAAEPGFRQNRLLEEQLARYRALAADTALAPPPFAATLHVGDAFPAAGQLARWLAALGDLPPDATAAEGYDAVLESGVRRFQARHGLATDGVIGPQTARALAVPLAARVRQIELALERLRWIPELDRGPAVFVNVPAFQLVALDDAGADVPPALEMAVVVGRAARTETPIFAGAMQQVVFAPYWNVPRSIVVGEILPKESRKPGYLDRQDMEVVAGGSVLGTGGDALAQLASGAARLRQRPGPRNSLGRVKFLFPNPYNVYLHDTPARTLFQRSRRDFSHGCIRVADPEALARWVLGPEGWDAAEVADALAATRSRVVALATPVPVVIYYVTAVARRDGSIAFYDDLYGHDAALERALAERE